MIITLIKANIVSAEVMKSLKISKGLRRVLFRTLNTDRLVIKLTTKFDMALF